MKTIDELFGFLLMVGVLLMLAFVAGKAIQGDGLTELRGYTEPDLSKTVAPPVRPSKITGGLGSPPPVETVSREPVSFEKQSEDPWKTSDEIQDEFAWVKKNDPQISRAFFALSAFKPDAWDPKAFIDELEVEHGALSEEDRQVLRHLIDTYRYKSRAKQEDYYATIELATASILQDRALDGTSDPGGPKKAPEGVFHSRIVGRQRIHFTRDNDPDVFQACQELEYQPLLMLRAVRNFMENTQ